MPKHVATIGAGPAGLADAKSLKEHDINVTIFERGDQLGGLWIPERPPMWKGLETNLSDEACRFFGTPKSSHLSIFPRSLSDLNQNLL